MNNSQWKTFIATNDVAERKDIAFAAAAELGSQVYRDQVKSDMERVFGKQVLGQLAEVSL